VPRQQEAESSPEVVLQFMLSAVHMVKPAAQPQSSEVQSYIETQEFVFLQILSKPMQHASVAAEVAKHSLSDVHLVSLVNVQPQINPLHASLSTQVFVILHSLSVSLQHVSSRPTASKQVSVAVHLT